MKICIDIPNRQVQAALNRVLFIALDAGSSCDDPRQADLVIVDSKERLHPIYSEDQFFAFFSPHEIKNLPGNARWIGGGTFPEDIDDYLKEIKEELASRGNKRKPVILDIATGVEHPPQEPTVTSLKILVVDDKTENLQLAIDLLGKSHFLTLASGYSQALALIQEYSFDAVLSDCQMLAEVRTSALSIEAISIGQTVHNGLFLIFVATQKGARVAIVTDAGHHNDWVSAMFDDKDIRRPQNVNGQPVLLINYMGKRWNEALNALLAL